MGVKKATNLELAAEQLNKILEICGANVRIEVEVEFSELKWGPFAEKFYLDFAAGKAPDIVTMREVGELAEGGFIVPVDEHIKMFWDMNYFDFYPNLWVTYEGKIWGIPHDICPAGVWYRKDVLRELGYTDEDVANLLPEDGGTTLEILARLAKEAVDAELVEYGILHRPSAGSNTYARLLEFGVDCYNPETGNLELDRSGLLAFYQWHKDMVDQGVIPPESPIWSTIHGTFVEGRTFATMASHVGTPAEWQEQYGLSDAALGDDLGFLPFPPTEEAKAVGGETVSVSDIPLYFVTTQSAHPELAKLLIMFATFPEPCAIHSSYTARPPYRWAALHHPLIAGDPYIQRTAASAQAVVPVPIHPRIWDFVGRIFEGVKGVEAGVVSPEAALDHLILWFQAEIPDGEIIE
jgi:inositol-phosphate transport system substrate-binding protein